jgi:hypothetical protein
MRKSSEATRRRSTTAHENAGQEIESTDENPAMAETSTTTDPESDDAEYKRWFRGFQKSESGSTAIVKLDALKKRHPNSYDQLREIVLLSCFRAATYRDVILELRKRDRDRHETCLAIARTTRKLVKLIQEIPDINLRLPPEPGPSPGHQVRTSPVARHISARLVVQALQDTFLPRPLPSNKKKDKAEFKKAMQAVANRLVERFAWTISKRIAEQQVGCLVYPKDIRRKKHHADERTQLMILLTYYFRVWSATWKCPELLAPAPLPKSGRSYYGNVTQLVEATLNPDEKLPPIDYPAVEKRVIRAIRADVMVAPWPKSLQLIHLFPDPDTGKTVPPIVVEVQ